MSNDYKLGDTWSTRQKVRISGQYQCQECGQEITCVADEIFPPCGTCKAAATWELVDITGQPDEAEALPDSEEVEAAETAEEIQPVEEPAPPAEEPPKPIIARELVRPEAEETSGAGALPAPGGPPGAPRA